MLRKVKQLLSNFEAERWENLSNLRLAKKSVAYKKNSSVTDNDGDKDKKVAKPLQLRATFGTSSNHLNDIRASVEMQS